MRSHIKGMYAYHNTQQSKKYKALLKSERYVQDNVSAIKNTIAKTVAVRLRNTIITLNSMLEVTTQEDVNKIISQLDIYDVTDNDVIFTQSILNGLISQKQKLHTIKNNIKNYDTTMINYDVFRKIIHKFNSKISEALLQGYKGYELGHGLGTIKIEEIDVSSIKRSYNFPKSIKKRNEILARGGTPYYKESAPDGEQWLVRYDTLVEYFWKWKSSPYLKNRSIFRFYPSNYYPTKDGSYIKSMEDIIYNYNIDELNNLSMGNVQRMHLLVAMDSSHSVKYKKDYDI